MSRVGIEIANESATAVDETAVVAVARFALERMGVSPLAELSMLLVDLDVMADLHERWMDLPGPTDVMAFPMDEVGEGAATGGGRPDGTGAGPALLGDIVLCPAFAAEAAAGAGHSLDDELHLLTVHGVLHLLGFEHGKRRDAEVMELLEREILATLGLPDPYAEN